MGLFRRTPKKKVKAKHWWRESVDSNQFRIMVDVVHPDSSKETKWVGVILLNGEMPLAAQCAAMGRICNG